MRDSTISSEETKMSGMYFAMQAYDSTINLWCHRQSDRGQYENLYTIDKCIV